MLFMEWLFTAIDTGVVEPHAATLSTVDSEGRPDARILILKDVTESGDLEIATTMRSVKGAQLDLHPECALTFYWRELARSVRVRGVAVRAPAEESARDFLARHPDSRASVLASDRESGSVSDEEHRNLIREERRRIDAEPDLVSPAWVVWRIEPSAIEFWQGSADREHVRLRYVRNTEGWAAERLRA